MIHTCSEAGSSRASARSAYNYGVHVPRFECWRPPGVCTAGRVKSTAVFLVAKSAKHVASLRGRGPSEKPGSGSATGRGAWPRLASGDPTSPGSTGLPGHGIELGLGPEPREPAEEGTVGMTAAVLTGWLSLGAHQQQQRSPRKSLGMQVLRPHSEPTRNWEGAQEPVFRGAPQLTETP